VMFGEPGHAYVYFSYGVHWMLNVVAHPPLDAAAILVRAAQPLDGLEEMYLRRPRAKRDEDLLSGPGKLCAAFGIGPQHNGVNLLDPVSRDDLRLEVAEPASHIVTTTRVGISVGKDYPWRFLDGDRLRWASKPIPKLT
jgi:DNA-3-methyladenine glycosylase